jgi:hypothetical protein
MTIGVYTITGNPVFDYFFSLVFFMGVFSVGPALIFKMLRY